MYYLEKIVMKKGSEDLFKVVYVMLITSTVMIYISIMLLYF